MENDGSGPQSGLLPLSPPPPGGPWPPRSHGQAATPRPSVALWTSQFEGLSEAPGLLRASPVWKALAGETSPATSEAPPPATFWPP